MKKNLIADSLPVRPSRNLDRNYYVANCLMRIHWAVCKLPNIKQSEAWTRVAGAIDSMDGDVRHMMLCDLMEKLEKEVKS